MQKAFKYLRFCSSELCKTEVVMVMPFAYEINKPSVIYVASKTKAIDSLGCQKRHLRGCTQSISLQYSTYSITMTSYDIME